MINLREIRKEKGITMKELGKIFGVSEVAISNYETDKREPDIKLMIKFANYFDVSVDYLLGNTKTATQKPSGVVLSEFESDIVGELRRLSKTDKQNLARIIFSYTQNYALVEKYKAYNSAFETAAND